MSLYWNSHETQIFKNKSPDIILEKMNKVSLENIFMERNSTKKSNKIKTNDYIINVNAFMHLKFNFNKNKSEDA